LTEAPDRTAVPERAEREDVVTSAASPVASASVARPLQVVLSLFGFMVLLLALPFVLLLDGSIGSWLFGAGLFVLSFTLALAINKVADQLDDVQAIGLIGIGSIIRALFIFGILFVVAYKVDRELALIASGVFAAAFTADLLGRTMIHALRAKERKAALDR
jgi:hypothetical protein